MMILRCAKEEDLDGILQLAECSGVGLTTLPNHLQLLKKRLLHATKAFKSKQNKLKEAYYLFVLEDTASKQLVGSSAIEALVGATDPFYSYKISKMTQVCHELHLRNEYRLLNLVNDYQGCSELCTLLLAPPYRGHHNGLLLSKARFLFMAQHPLRFANTIIAEMRGFFQKNDLSPFWEQVGKHFFQMPFAEADKLTLITNKQFIADLMPRAPLIVELLAKEAQAVIAKPHINTVPAVHILLKEGFRHNGHIDIFDAGPILEASLTNIQTVKKSKLVTLQNTGPVTSDTPWMLATINLDFRAVIGPVEINHATDTCILSEEIAKALQIKPGQLLRIAPLH